MPKTLSHHGEVEEGRVDSLRSLRNPTCSNLGEVEEGLASTRCHQSLSLPKNRINLKNQPNPKNLRGVRI